MKIRLATYWERLRTSYWFLPSLMSLTAAAMALAAVRSDSIFGESLPRDAWWLYAGGADGSRAFLAAIVGSMISVTSVVFSITIVSLTLASGQFGPRLLRNFMRDRANQMVLGTFIGTFIYALLVLLTVQSLEERAFVPQIAVTLAVVLVFVSIGVLIFFIHHIATVIQADSVIAAAAEQLSEAIDRLYRDPIGVGEASLPAFDAPESPFERMPGEVAIVSLRDDYVQGIDEERLMRVATEHDLVIRMTCRPGDFVIEGVTLAWTRGQGAGDDSVHAAVRQAVVLGSHRTLTQDAEFGFLQLVEIAVRVLSPGVNDPFTAISCIDRLCSALSRLSSRAFPPAVRVDSTGELRLVLDTTSFGGYADTTFNQLRQNGATSAAVMFRMLEGIARIGALTRDAERRAVLREHADRIAADGERALESTPDLHDLRARHAAANRALLTTAVVS